VARRRRWKARALALRLFFLVAGTLLVGFLTVFLEAVLHVYLPKHFAMALGVGLAVTITLWLLHFMKHPPLLLKNVPPLAAGICAGLGVHLARMWLR
jgi:hypothetical protein